MNLIECKNKAPMKKINEEKTNSNNKVEIQKKMQLEFEGK